ncbi:MAG: hypothetical protein PHY74_08025 [Candidatus Bathyarchaeota archaeon]|nr:hypothetical protein [Candidatus Bathyarchaeota archaeon]
MATKKSDGSCGRGPKRDGSGAGGKDGRGLGPAGGRGRGRNGGGRNRNK